MSYELCIFASLSGVANLRGLLAVFAHRFGKSAHLGRIQILHQEVDCVKEHQMNKRPLVETGPSNLDVQLIHRCQSDCFMLNYLVI